MALATSSKTGGYDYKFVEVPPDRLVCDICHFPSQDPYLTTCCGHVFCKSCLDEYKKVVSLSKICPVCRQKEFVAYVNKQLDREVKSLYVMCTNKERGCEWQGELNDIINHLGNSDGCQFEDVRCSNECGKMLQRRYLTSHVETECPCYKVECKYCHIIGGNQYIEGEHKKLCPNLPIPCPNKCTVGCPYAFRIRKGQRVHGHPYAKNNQIQFICRKDMEKHKEECPLQKVECSHKCGKVLQRRFLPSHVETECPRRKVDCQYCNITGEHQFIEGEHKEQCPKFPLPCPNKCEIGIILRQDMEVHRNECPLEMVQCEYHNVGCEERMMREKKRQHEEEKMELHLLLTKRRLTNDHQERNEELADTKAQLVKAVEEISALKMVLHQALEHNSGTTCDISVSKRWGELTTMAMLMKSGCQVCPIVVKVGGYSEKNNNLIQWYGDPFYSHDKGYKICLNVDAAGHGDVNGTHLSVYLYLMKGPHDDELTWPLRGKFEVKLLNQISDCEHLKKALNYDRAPDTIAGKVIDGNRAKSGWGLQKFISHEDLHKITPTCQYLKDDCIFLQVSKQQT